jgi:hypothetical protein
MLLAVFKAFVTSSSTAKSISDAGAALTFCYISKLFWLKKLSILK